MLKNILARFWRNEAGVAAIIFALCIPMFISAAGIAVDLAQAYNVKNRLSDALDKAALAAGSTDGTEDEIKDRAETFFSANYPEGGLGNELDVEVDIRDDNTVHMSATARVNTTFMAIMGQDHIDVYAETTTVKSQTGMEVVLVMDNTGSMADSAGGGVSKLSAAKTAATTLINTLYGPDSNIPVLWMGIVPFSQDVNIGSGLGGWTTSNSYKWGNTSWAGCVEERVSSGRDVTDDPPSVEKFPQYYSSCSSSNSNAWYGTNSSKNNCSTSGTIKYQSGLGSSFGPNMYCAQALTPMTNSKNTLLSGINSMQATGSTFINIGMAWGWRMLSPRWRGTWGGTMEANDLPLDYHTPQMSKVVILMTDGDNSFGGNDYTAYGVLSQGRIGTTSSNSANTKLNTKTGQVCSSLKANGVLVYTIALGNDINTTSRTLLSDCATSSKYYFESPTTDDLQDVFKAITDQLNNLHISQ